LKVTDWLLSTIIGLCIGIKRSKAFFAQNAGASPNRLNKLFFVKKQWWSGFLKLFYNFSGRSPVKGFLFSIT